MNLRCVPIADRCRGQLWLGAMPGRFESWPAFMAEARRCKLGLVVCLAPTDEMAALAPAYWRAIGEGSLGFRFLALPMQNYGLPLELAAFRAGIEHTAASLLAGDAVMLHCAAGIGRTGTAAACLLKRLGLSVDEAMQRVRDAGSNPQNALQSGLVNQF